MALLVRGVEVGDPSAIRLAANCRRRELLQALRKREAAAAENAPVVARAIETLEYATTRPAFRSASRPKT